MPGVLNEEADLLSRSGPHPGNWRLHPAVLEEIWRCSGRAVANLFASSDNSLPAVLLQREGLAHKWILVWWDAGLE